MTDDQKTQLSEEDMKRVESYLNSPIHQVKRKPFNPVHFILLTVGSVSGLLLLAMAVTRMAGIGEV